MTQQINEPVEFLDSSSNVIITINGEDASIKMGGNTKNGQLIICDSAGNLRFLVDTTSGHVDVLDAAGTGSVQINAETGDVTVVRMVDGVPQEVFKFLADEATLSLGAAGSAAGLIVRNLAGQDVMLVNGASAKLTIGAEGSEGDLRIRDSDGRDVIQAGGQEAVLFIGAEGNEGDLIIRDSKGRTVIQADGGKAALYLGGSGIEGDANDNEGDLIIRDGGGRAVIHADGGKAALFIGANGNEGDLIIRDGTGRTVIHADGGKAALFIGANGNEGDLIIRDSDGRTVIHADGDTAALYLGGSGVGTTPKEGQLLVRDSAGHTVIHADGNSGRLIIDEGSLITRNGEGFTTIAADGNFATLWIGTSGTGGQLLLLDDDSRIAFKLSTISRDLEISDSQGRTVFSFNADDATLHLGKEGTGGAHGELILYDDQGLESIRLDGETGNISMLGADTAEHFGLADGHTADPGTVLVIHEEGLLARCAQAYDRAVAGVVSGAGGLTPGVILGSQPVSRDRIPLALNGKAYCQVDARYAAVQVGDLLTTSPTPGYAMKAADPQRAFGAVIGKALRPLQEGVGLIPILVSLQ